MRIRKGFQQDFVISIQRIHDAENQHNYLALTCGQLDLRNLVSQAQLQNQRLQRRNQSRNCRHQHLATIHIRYEARGFLVKPHQHALFFLDIFHAQTRFMAITPGWAIQRRQHIFRFHFADMLQVIFKQTLFGCDLRGKIQMLQFAATTQTKVRTFWLDALIRLLKHFHHVGDFIAAFDAVSYTHLDVYKRQFQALTQRRKQSPAKYRGKPEIYR